MRSMGKMRKRTKKFAKGRTRIAYRKCQICSSRKQEESVFSCLYCRQIICEDCKEKLGYEHMKVALEPISLNDFEYLRQPIIILTPLNGLDQEYKRLYHKTTTTRGRQLKPNSKYFSEIWISN